MKESIIGPLLAGVLFGLDVRAPLPGGRRGVGGSVMISPALIVAEAPSQRW